MATRLLPGVYGYLNDLSQLPEGANSLNVGYVVKSERGPVNEWGLVTSPTDFLTKYTFSGQPKQTDDPTMHSILKVLAQTNNVYVVRAANNPLYGGAVVRKAKEYGVVTEVSKENETITIEGEEVPEIDEIIMITGSNVVDGYYVVKAVEGKTITVTGDIVENYQGTSEEVKLVRCPIVPLANIKIGDIYSVDSEEHAFYLDGNVYSKYTAGDKITVKGSSESGYVNNDGDYTVISSSFDIETNKTKVVVEEDVTSGNDGSVYFNSLVNPESFANFFTDDYLMFIAGIDPGAYNGKLALTILSSLDNPDSLVYHKGARGIFDKPCSFDTMQLGVINTETNEVLESFLFSRDPDAKAIDGSLLFVDDIVNGSSAYIQIINNPESVDVPNSTLSGLPVQASGGSNGEAVTPADLVRALTVFSDKTIPVSILGNGCSTEAESPIFQQALIELATTRRDVFVFLNSRKVDEKATLPSTRAQNIVDYKKNTLANTSFYGCMYAPHVKTPDIFNSREVEIGTDGVAIAGWLNVINSLNYPYAYAGPRNGLVTGVTSNWKIGDMSGEAEILNDASINYIAYDGKVGRYYMQTQNTLQVANSAMRNIGVVLNILDIKETLITDLKEYIQLPITDDLRRDILDTVNDYLSPMMGVRFYNYSFQDITSEADIANDTLRYLVTISPTRYSKLIYLSMNIVNSTFDFSILQSA